MRTIIIATDFSAVAENATTYAAKAAKQIGAKLVVFHLHTMSIHAVNARVPPAGIQQLIDINRSEVHRKAALLRELYGIDVEADWYTGDFHDSLQVSIEHHQADLVVMGMAPKSIEQDLLGNTTTATIHKLPFPVLAVPLGVQFKGIKRVLFACDVLHGVQRKLLQQVKNAIHKFGAEVEIFHVSDKVRKLEEQGEGNMVYDSSFGEEFEGITYYFKNVHSNAVIQEISNEIKLMKADLLIMVPHKYGFWSSLVHRSKTRIMSSHSEVPLLSIPLSALS